MGSFLNFPVQGPRLALPRPGAVGSSFMRGRDPITAGSSVTLKLLPPSPLRLTPSVPFWQARVLASESAVWPPSSPQPP